MITFGLLIQFGMYTISLVDLCLRIFKKEKVTIIIAVMRV